jgi:holo-[acyl-carrier protein] synthase
VIGIGADLVDVARLRRTLERTPGLVARLFTEGERAYAEARADPTERYAARFAAKEAVMKALGVGLGAVGWHEIEVVRGPSGQPFVVLTGRAAALADDRGIGSWLLTLSHTATVAEAIAVAR